MYIGYNGPCSVQEDARVNFEKKPPAKWRERQLFFNTNVRGWIEDFILVSHGSFRDMD